MDRRTFMAMISGGLLAAPRAVEGQPAGKVWRIGYLTPSLFSRPTFLAVLRELGYVEGQTIRLEVRGAENDLARLPALAAELVRSEVDIIVAVAPPAILATVNATKTIPIVMAFWGAEGLIESGIVQTFAKPGRNITGLYMLAAELEGKRLELLLAAVPTTSRTCSAATGTKPCLTPSRKRTSMPCSYLLTLSSIETIPGSSRRLRSDAFQPCTNGESS